MFVLVNGFVDLRFRIRCVFVNFSVEASVCLSYIITYILNILYIPCIIFSFESD